MRSFLLILLILFHFCCCAKFPQLINHSTSEKRDSISFFRNAPQINKQRTHVLNYSVAGLYALSMSWLYTQWYSDYPRSKFHFFNDNSEWEQMDKYAHGWDAYSIARPLTACYRWAGYNNKKSTLYGAGIAFLFQTTVEVFDGFSSEWGFSGGDILANTAGTALFASQQLIWQQQRIVLKYSFHQTAYSKYRPDLLGSDLPENILKDYNGLTYWLTVNPRSFFRYSTFPAWLNIAAGFGAEGMTGGRINSTEYKGENIPASARYRQYYLSLDIDLARIKTPYKLLNSLFSIINIVHLPAPAIEFDEGKRIVWRGLYF